MRSRVLLLAASLLALAAIGLLLTSGVAPHPMKAQEAESTHWVLELFDHRGDDSGEGILGWGYSLFIRHGEWTILFDGGTSAEVLAHNARSYGVDLADVDFAVLSHRHGDHTAGIDYLLKVNPDVRLYVPSDGAFGYDSPAHRQYRPGYRYQTDSVSFVGESAKIEDGIHLIYTESDRTGTFWRYPPNEEVPELIQMPELSLALEAPTGELLLITGCSHSGVEKIVKETRRTTGEEVTLLTGGFHLLPYPAEYVSDLAHRLRDELGVGEVAPTHCTGDDAIQAFEDVYGDSHIATGLGTRIAWQP